MSEKTKGEEVGRTSDVGYTRLSQISGDALTPADIQRSIDGAMRGVIADALRGGSNPNASTRPKLSDQSMLPLSRLRGKR
jgi:hypothetical protein